MKESRYHVNILEQEYSINILLVVLEDQKPMYHISAYIRKIIYPVEVGMLSSFSTAARMVGAVEDFLDIFEVFTDVFSISLL